jgi:hypothetical protein
VRTLGGVMKHGLIDHPGAGIGHLSFGQLGSVPHA